MPDLDWALADHQLAVEVVGPMLVGVDLREGDEGRAARVDRLYVIAVNGIDVFLPDRSGSWVSRDCQKSFLQSIADGEE